ncbi:FkbM family methyltransferase [Roseibaca sp. Y0-43]|uniref:FkbM family methyltransferase n=1 Tax=Roseibaca sp. Y0-43 TaxID=2816854 RepID=UPI001D0CA87F|nr:FkbM family methyltransferase [Roseibaca sp. Y0-43]MCC1481530.1 FkbM family methyltransferase [Roseibaca sp. Y0-43]
MTPAQALATLSARAAMYDLRDRAARARSAADLRKMFFALLPAVAPDLFIEAGAHDGAGSRRARKLLPKARVIACEANPHNHARFAKAHDFDALNVEYRLTALSDADGPITFKVLTADQHSRQGVHSGRSSLMLRDDPKAEYESVTVPGLRLDSLAQDGTRAALWVDVEGAAQKVLAGADALLDKTALMMIEVESAPFWQGQWLVHDVMAHLMDKGLVPVARDFERKHQFNILFLSPQAMTLPDVLPVLEMQQSLARFRADTGA